ncbi:uncharacterized protein LOC123321967 isoform X2 [Coccinella septempunctata]|uniref:uncharacterized protein LOC123321967 isoform X2 n=1 Tax=Coccinella septempunctata TaxID=41139 RepID=UPI001D074572|nr:uncharacterized protein LOC123321967 isoform X2 [Coccinella septempunctata]
MEGFRIPPTMDFNGNTCHNWSIWEQKFDIYMLAAVDTTDIKEQKKVAIFLNLIGEQGVEIFNTLNLKLELSTLKDVKAAFQKYCDPKKNIIFDRYKFLSCNQKEGQSISNYITEIKTLVKVCEYQDEDEMIRDKIILGIKDNNLREKLLQYENLSLKKTEEICNVTEVSRKQAEAMIKEEKTPEVDTINRKPRNKISEFSNVNSNNLKICNKCGLKHFKFKCPAFGKICAYCKKPNHFASCCFSKRTRKNVKNKFEVETTSFHEDDVNDDFFIDSLESSQLNSGKNSGAECNIIPTKVYFHLGSVEELSSARVTLMAFGRKMVKVNFLVNHAT